MKRKSIFRKVTALMCCLAMLFTTFTPVYAAGEADNVGLTATMSVPEGVEIYRTRNAEAFEATNKWKKPTDTSKYQYKYNGSEIIFAASGDSISGVSIVFYVNATLKPEISTNGYDDICAVAVDDTQVGANNLWKVTLKFSADAAEIDEEEGIGNINLALASGVQKYNITFPASGRDYSVTVNSETISTLNGNVTASYAENTKLEVAITLTDRTKGQKDVSVWSQAKHAEISTTENDSVYTFTYIVTTNDVVEVNLDDKKFSVTLPKGVGYTCKPAPVGTPATGIAYGNSFSFTVTPADGYRTPTVKFDDVTLEPEDGVYTIENITKNVTVTVTVEEIPKLTVTGPELKDGFVYTPTSDVTTVQEGGSFSFTVTAKPGYGAPTVLVNGTEVTLSNDGQYTITNIKADVAITVEPGEKFKYSVRFPDAGTGFNYTIEGDKTSFGYGDVVKFKVTATAGYKIDYVMVGEDDLEPDADGYYTITVTKTTVVTVEASKRVYSVTYEPAAGFSFGGVEGTFEYGTNYTFTVTPATGYKVPVVKISVNGATATVLTLTAAGNYTFPVTGNTVITIENLGKITHTVTLPHGEEYTAEFVGDYKEKVEHDGEVKFTVTAKTGFTISRVTAGNTTLTPEIVDNKIVYTVSNVTADVSVTVYTLRSVHAVTYTYPKGQGGFTAEEGVLTATYGTVYEFRVTPALGYNAPTVKVNDKEIKPTTGDATLYRTTIYGNTTIEITGGGKFTYKVDLHDGPGYKLSYTLAEGKDKVEYGDTVVVTLVVDEHYSASVNKLAVYNNGNRVAYTKKEGADRTYTVTLTNVTADVSVSADGLQENQYTVQLVPGAGYTLSTNDSTSLTAGSTFNFTVTVLPGYTGTAKFVVNDDETNEVEIPENGYCTITVEGNTKIKVIGLDQITFEPKVEVDKDAAEVTYNSVVTYGGNFTITVTAKPGYRVDSVICNDVEVPKTTGTNSYTVTNVTDDITVKVVTSKYTLTINYVSDELHHEYNSPVSVPFEYGATVVHPNLPGCTIHNFAGWLLNGKEVTQEALMALIANGDAEITLKASFVVKDDFSELFELLPTTAIDAGASGGYSSHMLYRTVARATKLLESDKCIKEYVTVTALGTLLSNKEEAFSDENVAEIKSQIKNRSLNTPLASQLNINGYSVYNYFNDKVTMTLADVDGRYLELAMATNKPDKLYSAGWMELTIAGKKVVFVSKAYVPAKKGD